MSSLTFSGLGQSGHTGAHGVPQMAVTGLGQYIRELREAKGLSGLALAELAEVDQPLLNRVENGKRPASDDFLRKLAPHLGVTYADLHVKRLMDDVRLLSAEHQAALAGEIQAEIERRGDQLQGG